MSPRMERWVWRLCAVGLAGATVAALLTGPWNLLAGSVTGSAAGARDAPCLPGREIPIMDSPHVSPEELAATRYNSSPPTSGPHFAFAPATGIYTAPVSDGLTVHAMEHGHVIVHYAPGTPDDTVARLRSLAKRYAADVILAPSARLDSGVALTAWGRLALFDDYDETGATAFIEQLRDRYVHGWTNADDCP